MNRKKRLSIGVGLAILAIAAGLYWWNAPQASQQAQVDGKSPAVTRENKQPEEDTRETEQKDTAAEGKKLPAKDTLAMTFEGTKTYIVAGSASSIKNGTDWKAEIRNGEAGKISQVEFKQEGKTLMTRNDGGAWRPLDEMDRTLFHKLMEILDKQ